MIIFLYASLLGFLYFVISISVIKARGKHQISLGSGSKDEIIHLVSAHNNFASYTPFFLLSFYLLENSGLNLYVLHLMGITFLLGRLFHFLTMKDKEATFKYRKAGMMMTLWPLIISSSILLTQYLKQFL
jgi:uncharacterized membrane protein YecN with MAPEG domain